MEFLDIHGVCRLVGVRDRRDLYRLPGFPAPAKLVGRKGFWLAEEIHLFRRSRLHLVLKSKGVSSAPTKFRMDPIIIGNATLYLNDSAAILPSLSDLDSVVTDGPYGLQFMGKAWDYGVPKADFWNLCLAAMKPGAFLLNFASARTYHRMAVEVEDGGFKVVDQIMWAYGSGMPKGGRNVSRDIDAALGHEREIIGHQKALGYEPLQALHGVQSVNVDGHPLRCSEAIKPEAEARKGFGTILKPAHEPIIMAQKRFKGSVARNVLEHGTGALNIDGCRVEGGRWPANLVHDGSEVIVGDFPGDSARFFYCPKPSTKERDEGLDGFKKALKPWFQTANGTSGKASPMGAQIGQKRARANQHPTVKPVALMRYLCRLVTPPQGLILDPFLGSGTTGVAAMKEGFKFVGIERDPESFAISCARIAHAQGLPVPAEVWQFMGGEEDKQAAA